MKINKLESTGALNSDDLSLASFMGVKDKDLLTKADLFLRFSKALRDKGQYAYRRPLAGPCENRVKVVERTTGKVHEMIMMGSNNYLGLTNHPKVVEAAEKAMCKYGVGSGGVPLLSGTLDIHSELEARVAALKGCEDAVLFSSGYAANLGVLAAMLGPEDVVINDRLNHASIIDGCRLSHSEIAVFEHNDMKDLEKLLGSLDPQKDGKLIVVDGVYSMDGDIAPLPEIVNLAKKHGARTMVDEAHATGVVGPGGKGSLAHHGVEGKIDFVTVTFSKGLGCQGGAIACSKSAAEYLRFYSRSTFFSTSLAPPVAAGVIAAIEILEKEPERVERLWQNIQFMCRELKNMGYRLGETQSAVIPIMICDDIKLREMGRDIHEQGIYLSAIPYPAVPKGLARFRLNIMATHTDEDLERTLEVLKQVGLKHGILNQP